MPKLIFLDIDGTLLLPGRPMSQRVAQALRRAKQNGHKLFLCTGRSRVMLPAELTAFGFDGIVCSAGGYVTLGDRVILDQPIPAPIVRTALDAMTGLYRNLECQEITYGDPLDPAETLRSVGLGERLNNFPAQLSGGEQQRVAIARALAKNPKLLLCDEPTGALDYQTGKQILKLLQDTCRQRGVSVIVITHNLALTAMGDKVIKVRSGRIESVEINEHPLPVERIEY